MLTMVDGTERLQYVLKQVKDAAGMATARKLAKQITDSSDEDSKDLEVRVFAAFPFGIRFDQHRLLYNFP